MMAIPNSADMHRGVVCLEAKERDSRWYARLRLL